MARIKRGTVKRRRRKAVLKAAAGYRGARSRRFRIAKEQLLHSLTYAYRDRRDRKGTFRRLWIARINAAARANGLPYNRFMEGLRKLDISTDRKVLAGLAVDDPKAFSELAAAVKGLGSRSDQ